MERGLGEFELVRLGHAFVNTREGAPRRWQGCRSGAVDAILALPLRLNLSSGVLHGAGSRTTRCAISLILFAGEPGNDTPLLCKSGDADPTPLIIIIRVLVLHDTFPGPFHSSAEHQPDNVISKNGQ